VGLTADERPSIELEFSGQVIVWSGPAPYTFVRVPDAEASDIKAVASLVTYGWGVIPVSVRIGQTQWTTSLFPKDGGYLVPIKVAAQKAEGIEVGDVVTIELSIALPEWIPADR
jgi:uncharacterized protein DUF1905